MADLRLLEFVLLKASFDVRLESAQANWVDEIGVYDFAQAYPTDDLLGLSSNVERIDDHFLLVMDVGLDDARLPFQLTLQVGARFLVTDDSELTANRVHSTLIFMSFPYLRETIANLTSRSPFATYALPPLTKLPDAPVRGEQEAVIVRASEDEGQELDEPESKGP